MTYNLPLSPVPSADDVFSFSNPIQNILIGSGYNSGSYVWNLESGMQLGFIETFNLFFYSGDPLLSISNSIYYLDPNHPRIYMWSTSNFTNGNSIETPEFNITFPEDRSDVGVWIQTSMNGILAIGRSYNGIDFCLGVDLISVADNQAPSFVMDVGCMTGINGYAPYDGYLVNMTMAIVLVHYESEEYEGVDLVVINAANPNFYYLQDIVFDGYDQYPEFLVGVPSGSSSVSF